MIQPVQSFNNMSTKKKVATVVIPTVAIGATVAAGIHGKNMAKAKGEDVKLFNAIKNGFVDGFKQAKAKVQEFFKKGKGENAKAAEAEGAEGAEGKGVNLNKAEATDQAE